MIDDDIGVVLLSPLLAECPIEPSVVSGDEVTPLENLQSLLLRRSTFRKQEKWTGRGAQSKSTTPRPPDEVST